MNRSECERQESETISLYIDDEFTTARARQEFEQHLKSCRRCQEELNEQRQTDKTIRQIFSGETSRHLETNEMILFRDGLCRSMMEESRIRHHLQNCDACNQLYQSLDELDTLQRMVRIRIPWRYLLSSWLERFKAKMGQWFHGWRVLLPVTAAVTAVIMSMMLYQRLVRPPALSQLAVVAPYPYAELGLRGGDTRVNKAFRKAMQAYNAGNYVAASQALEHVLTLDANHGPSHFFLGVSYFMLHDLSRAQQQFETAIRLHYPAGTCHWYLAHIYLLKNDRKQAIQHLQQVIEQQDTFFASQARKMLQRLQ